VFLLSRDCSGKCHQIMFKPGDKVVVFQYDGKEFRGVVVLTEVHTSGNKVRVRSGDFILNVDEKQVAKMPCQSSRRWLLK
jgi:hypothetical protein